MIKPRSYQPIAQVLNDTYAIMLQSHPDAFDCKVYATGEVSVSFTEAPVQDVEIHIGFDVHIEQDPSLIPRIDHQMFSHVLYPHESAITGNATIQAIWALRRELGLDIDNMTMQALRNLLAADKDRKHLTDMMFHAKSSVEWVRVGSRTRHVKAGASRPKGLALTAWPLSTNCGSQWAADGATNLQEFGMKN